MGWFERTRVWRALGKLTNSPLGVRFMSSARGLVERAMRPLAAADRSSEIPFTPMEKPLGETRVSLITTTGVYLEGQEPFDVDAALGDSSYRAIPSDVDVRLLRIAHTHYPHDRAKQDINVIFPLERLRELVEEGVIGSLSTNFYSFGFDLHVQELVNPETGTAHEVARALREDQVDVALFTPG